MSTPLSPHHITPPFSSDNPPLRHPSAAKTTNKPTLTPHPCLALLDKCSDMSQLKQIHAHMLRTGLFFSDAVAASNLATATAGLAGLGYARLVLAQISGPTAFTCNSVIRAYADKDSPLEAVLLFREMLVAGFEPDRFSFPSLLKRCRDLRHGRQLHCCSAKLGFASDSYVQNTLVRMYSNCGRLELARKVFDEMVAERTVVSWATMIGAHAQWGQPVEAIELFVAMMGGDVRPNEVTLVIVLGACAKAGDLGTAKRVHKYADKNGFGWCVKLRTALMDAYCKCGCVSLAQELFDEMAEKKNLFCWNVLINGYVEESDYEEAFLLFREMQFAGEKGDKVTVVGLLLACARLGALELGKWLHAYIEREKIEVDVTLGTALVDMYAKCGGIEIALQVFKRVAEKDVMTWTALITGLAMCGEGETALEYFHEMQIEGSKPDAVTFVGVLAACSHAGLVDEGVSHFNAMSSTYGIEPSIEHYGAMVDILGRAGKLAEAEELIWAMPMAPDRFVLGGLLGACRIHGNRDLAERVSQQLLELAPANEGTYVLLSNIYSSFKKWDDAKRVRQLMAERNVNKSPGCSLIEVDGTVHEFVKGDSSHPKTAMLYQMLHDMIGKLKKVGYVPEKSEALLDTDEEEKERALSLHSEKLAIAFGLLSTNPGTPIRVVKNLRVCTDCHTAIKLISRVYKREIIVRDRNRFHRFQDGSCSCNDFW